MLQTHKNNTSPTSQLWKWALQLISHWHNHQVPIQLQHYFNIKHYYYYDYDYDYLDYYDYYIFNVLLHAHLVEEDVLVLRWGVVRCLTLCSCHILCGWDKVRPNKSTLKKLQQKDEISEIYKTYLITCFPLKTKQFKLIISHNSFTSSIIYK